MAARQTTHNLWKRHGRERQSNHQSRPISEVLTITSVNPLVMKGNACLIKPNVKCVDTEPVLPKYDHNSPAEFSFKDESLSSNKTQNQASNDRRNEPLTCNQTKDLVYCSSDVGPKNQNYKTTESKPLSLCNSRRLGGEFSGVIKHGHQDKLNTVTADLSTHRSPQLQTGSYGRRPSTLSCAGFKILSLQRMAGQCHKLGRKQTETSTLMFGPSKSGVASQDTLCLTSSAKPEEHKMITDPQRSSPFQDPAKISIQGSPALSTTNQRLLTLKDVSCKEATVPDVSKDVEVTVNPTHPSNSSKSLCYFKMSTNFSSDSKHWVNPVSRRQVQIHAEIPSSGHNISTKDDINTNEEATDIGFNPEKSRDLQKSLPCVQPTVDSISNCKRTSNLTDMKHVLKAIPEKAEDINPIEKIPESQGGLSKRNSSLGSEQVITEDLFHNISDVSVCSDVIQEPKDQPLRQAVSANHVNSKYQSPTCNNITKLRRNVLRSKCLAISAFSRKRSSDCQAKTANTTATETKTVCDKSQEDAKLAMVVIKPDEFPSNGIISKAHPENNAKTKPIPESGADIKRKPTKMEDDQNNPENVMICSSAAEQNGVFNGHISESMSSKCTRAFLESECVLTNTLTSEDEAGNVECKEDITKPASDVNPTSVCSGNLQCNIAKELTDATSRTVSIVETQNVTVNTSGTDAISEDMDNKFLQVEMGQNKSSLQIPTQMSDIAAPSKKSSDICKHTENTQGKDSDSKPAVGDKTDKPTIEKLCVKNADLCEQFDDGDKKPGSVPGVYTATDSQVARVSMSSDVVNQDSVQDVNHSDQTSKEQCSITKNSVASNSLNDNMPETQRKKDDTMKQRISGSFEERVAEEDESLEPKVGKIKPDQELHSEMHPHSMKPHGMKISSNYSDEATQPEPTTGYTSEHPGSGSTLSKLLDDNNNNASKETQSVTKQSETGDAECKGPYSHHTVTLEKKTETHDSSAADPLSPDALKEEANREDHKVSFNLEDCTESNNATIAATKSENLNRGQQQNKRNVSKPQSSPATGNLQHPGPTTVSSKTDSPKSMLSNHSQTKTKPQRSQYLTSKQTDAVYSQKLPRMRGHQTVVKPKEDTSDKSSAAWARVQSAQPQVFRGMDRTASRGNQRRSKSAMDMAGSKERASRCHCQRRLPGTERGSCHCNQTLEESSPSSEAEPKTDLDRQAKWFSMYWDQCRSDNTLEKALHILQQMPTEQRHRLVREVDSGRTAGSLLMTCCLDGNLHMVTFLLQDCGVHADRREEYLDTHALSPSPSTHKDVTALWCAAVEGHVEIVRALLRHGADIHAKSANGSSAVRSASYRLQTGVVQVLLQAGADVHSPNADGVTCLMNGCNSPELCHLLLRHGARPNDKDVSGNTALHYAAAVGQLQSLRLLQQFGGNVTEKNGASNSVLRCAALRGWLHIVDYLAHCCGSLSMAEVIEAYELAGSTLIDFNDNDNNNNNNNNSNNNNGTRNQFYEAGVQAWKKALHLRHISGIPKNRLRQEKIAPFQFRLEFASQQDLDRIVSNPHEARIHALLVKERICGPRTEELIEAVMARGETCLETGLYRSAIDLWMHAFHLLLDPSCSLGSARHYSPHRIVKLFWNLTEQQVKDEDDVEILKVSDTLGLLQLLVTYLNTVMKRRKPQPSPMAEVHSNKLQLEGCFEEVAWDTYLLHLRMTLHLINLISTCQQLLPQELQRFHQTVYRLVKADHRSGSGESLLHVCFRLPEIEPGRHHSRLPSVQLLETLLHCGAEADAVNHLGETPLFYIFMRPAGGSSFRSADQERWAQVLLRGQAHADRRTPDRRGVLRSLKKLDSFCCLSHVSLQCLAAQIIRDCSIHYRDPELLPQHLISFVAFH